MEQTSQFPSFTLAEAQVENNIRALLKHIQQQKLGAALITSFDVFISEYVPQSECLRYYITGFTGSVALTLVSTDRVYLFVDGRYHEQADKEVTCSQVEVVKVPFGLALLDALKTKVKDLKINDLGVLGERTPFSMASKLIGPKLSLLDAALIYKLLNYHPHHSERAIFPVELSKVGVSVKQKLHALVNKDEAVFVSALDSLAWLANCRGFHMPFQSQFMGKGFATKEHLYIFILAGTQLASSLKNNSDAALSFHTIQSWADVGPLIKKIISQLKIQKIHFLPQSINLADYEMLKEVMSSGSLIEDPNRILNFQMLKNECEIGAFEQAFERSDRAIFRALTWLRQSYRQGHKVSESEFKRQVEDFYLAEGAIAQSFNTISGFGANSSIIHYGGADAQKMLGVGEFALLDSGAYYECGYATDTTRTVSVDITPTPRQKFLYTLVLKGLLRALYAVFPVATHGSQIDALARFGLRQHGLDYGHGTGHGVGVNVHEGGFSITPVSTVPLVANLVGSLEPGVYIPGEGGVRLENIVVVIPHPKFAGMLTFRSLTLIGFIPELIEQNLLMQEEKEWLLDYESQCARRGRSFQ